MPEINHIKKLRNEKSLSINEISRRTGFSWETVKKYADGDLLPSESVPKKRGMMYDEKWGEIVSDWLMEDHALKKKLRRNNKIIYKQLKELEFPGSYRTVCNFIAEWKDRLMEDDEEFKEEYDRLTHPPAEAQIDFGITEAIQDGKAKDIHCLVMSLPYSNGGYTVPLPGENQECFLEGLKVLFNQFGRVPRKLRIDNLAAAVVKARGNHGDTVFTEAFQRFASHYGFEPQACNARKGNEKGHVENKVGYVRYNFFTPSPVIQDLEQLREMLAEQSKKDHERGHYKKGEPIKDLIEEEKKYCLALPENDYPVFKKELVSANKYGEVTIDKKAIHIPTSYHYNPLHLITYWDSYKVISPNGEILGKGPRPYMSKSREIPWTSILKMWRRKPRSVPYSRYFPYLPGRIASYLHIESKPLRKERIEWLMGLIIKFSMAEINEKFYELLPQQEDTMFELEDHPYEVNWSMYDSLRPAEPVLEGEEDC
ncbi:IS21 family transposase [Gracilibacillus thailandensis]|nr:IS21 family transposase [Gracilibacillus thailandensis]